MRPVNAHSLTFFFLLYAAQGEAVYIDTEGSFMEERAKDIATAFVTHVKKMADQSQQKESQESETERNDFLGDFSVILHGLSCHACASLLGASCSLPQLKNEHAFTGFVPFGHRWMLSLVRFTCTEFMTT